MGNLLAVAQGMLQTAETTLTAGIGPAVVAEPGDGLQVVQQGWVCMAVSQHIHLLTRLPKYCCYVTDIERPVAIARLERFLKDENFQWC